MTAYDIIMKKRRGSELSNDEIEWITKGFVSGDIPDYQMSALLMAICFNGMSPEETSALTSAMINSGDTYAPSKELGQICIDKHSTGGIGDKTTLIAAPICAACGVYVPKMSGRGLGHTGGTIDKLEAIPGLRTSLTHSEFISIIREAGFAISGQTGSLVPADKKIYALRNATATVDSIPLICSSIMSKKLATGADGIVLDVKVGDGAFMKNYGDAEKLAEAMIRVGKLAGRKCTAVLTNMEKPLGMAVGNAVEVVEAIEALKGNCPEDLYEISITLAAEMLFLAGLGSPEKCRELASEALSSGKALKSLEKMAELQGGDPKALYDYTLLGIPTHTKEVISDRDGYISGISCEKTGLISLSLGAGRKVKGGDIDPTAGIIFNKTVGDYVKKGESLGKLVTSSSCDIDAAAEEFIRLFRFSDAAPEKAPSVIKIIRN
ncbi:MAG: thymidine phosphorylase [Huintestinicola sp.]|uniref:thymidine phosphorylase n=1 Tax=Huintestinicola sp. TaxID=2981661 RepID=UPI003EFD3549